jgi:hypothetical protein
MFNATLPKAMVCGWSILCVMMSPQGSDPPAASSPSPGGLCYLPVPEHSVMWRMGVLWQFPAYAVALGSSYFQRLLVALPHLAAAVRCVPSLRSYWDQLVELGAAGQQVGGWVGGWVGGC